MPANRRAGHDVAPVQELMEGEDEGGSSSDANWAGFLAGQGGKADVDRLAAPQVAGIPTSAVAVAEAVYTHRMGRIRVARVVDHHVRHQEPDRGHLEQCRDLVTGDPRVHGPYHAHYRIPEVDPGGKGQRPEGQHAPARQHVRDGEQGPNQAARRAHPVTSSKSSLARAPRTRKAESTASGGSRPGVRYPPPVPPPPAVAASPQRPRQEGRRQARRRPGGRTTHRSCLRGPAGSSWSRHVRGALRRMRLGSCGASGRPRRVANSPSLARPSGRRIYSFPAMALAWYLIRLNPAHRVSRRLTFTSITPSTERLRRKVDDCCCSSQRCAYLANSGRSKISARRLSCCTCTSMVVGRGHVEL